MKAVHITRCEERDLEKTLKDLEGLQSHDIKTIQLERVARRTYGLYGWDTGNNIWVIVSFTYYGQ